MATDKTEPPILRIVGIGAISIGILVGLQFAFVSYFQQMYEAQATVDQAETLRRESYYRPMADTELQQRLSSVPGAMQAYASGARPELVTPRASTDNAALQGWGLMPRAVPVAPVVAPAAPAAEPAAVTAVAPLAPIQPAAAGAPGGPALAAPGAGTVPGAAAVGAPGATAVVPTPSHAPPGASATTVPLARDPAPTAGPRPPVPPVNPGARVAAPANRPAAPAAGATPPAAAPQ